MAFHPVAASDRCGAIRLLAPARAGITASPRVVICGVAAAADRRREDVLTSLARLSIRRRAALAWSDPSPYVGPTFRIKYTRGERDDARCDPSVDVGHSRPGPRRRRL